MDQKVGIEMRLHILKRLGLMPGPCHHGRRMTQGTADTRTAGTRAEQLLPAESADRKRHGFWRRQLAHENCESQPIRYKVQRVVEGLVTQVVGVGARYVVRFVDPLVASWSFVPGSGEHIIGHAHFNVVRLAREDRQRLVLRLPSEASDGSIVTTPVRNAA